MIGPELRRYWPPPGQRLLLEAALAPPDAARAAWQSWLAGHRVETATWFEARLLASLAPRLDALVPRQDIPAKLVGLRRYVWTRTQHTLASAAPLLRAFSEAGVRMMPLKGAARFAAAGADQPSRCLSDIDLLLHPDDWENAARIAYGAGWQGRGWDLDGYLRHAFAHHHSVPFSKDGAEVDLHHLALFMSRNQGDDHRLWARAGTGRLAGVALNVPGPTDQLFLILAHALLHAPEPSGDWMLDAAALISSGEIDWNLLEEESVLRALEPSVAVPLAFLAEHTSLPIPGEMLRRLIRRIRPPLAGDFVSHATTYRPTDPVLVDAVRAAAGIRALRAARRRLGEGAPPPRYGTLLDLRPELPVDGSGAWFAVPESLPPSAQTRMELSFTVSRTSSRGRPIILEMEAPGMTLMRWQSAGEVWPWWRPRRMRVSFELPAALFTERRIRDIGLHLRDARQDRRSPVKDLRLLWKVTGQERGT